MLNKHFKQCYYCLIIVLTSSFELAYSADSTDKQKRVTYEKIVDMLEKNVPITQISKELDVARNTIYRIRDEMLE